MVDLNKPLKKRKPVEEVLGIEQKPKSTGKTQNSPLQSTEVLQSRPVNTAQPATFQTEEQRKENANAFIRAREKLLSGGASLREATASAFQQTQSIGADKFDPLLAQNRRDAVSQIGQPAGIVPETQSSGIPGPLIAVGAGVGSSALTGALSAGAGAAAGTSFLGPGAIAVGVAAFGTALVSDARQSVKRDFNGFTNSRTNLQKIIDAANSGMDPLEAVTLYNQELAKIARAHSSLKLKTMNSLENFLGNPGDELQDIESFYAVQYGMLNEQFAQALAMPDPSKIVPQFNVPKSESF